MGNYVGQDAHVIFVVDFDFYTLSVFFCTQLLDVNYTQFYETPG